MAKIAQPDGAISSVLVEPSVAADRTSSSIVELDAALINGAAGAFGGMAGGRTSDA